MCNSRSFGSPFCPQWPNNHLDAPKIMLDQTWWINQVTRDHMTDVACGWGESPPFYFRLKTLTPFPFTAHVPHPAATGRKFLLALSLSGVTWDVTAMNEWMVSVSTPLSLSYHQFPHLGLNTDVLLSEDQSLIPRPPAPAIPTKKHLFVTSGQIRPDPAHLLTEVNYARETGKVKKNTASPGLFSYFADRK